jgi:Sulfotransferase family
MSSHPLQLSVDELLARSREMAGVEIVDDEVVEPLTVLHRALNKERAQLDAEGARAFEQKLLRLLGHRLRMKRDFRLHPEIPEQPIKGPVIVMGMARSGTTKLQKVLAASGDFNFLTFWQAFNWASVSGEPNEPTEERIAEAAAFCRWFDERSPDTKLGHAFDALEPEEEGVLTEASFVTPTFVGFAEVPGYGRWLGGQPPTIEFEFLRDALKYLQWQGLASADRTWLLKSPSYSSHELEILEVFPDARFVMAHRSPLQTVPSMCKLVGHFRTAYGTSDPDPMLLLEHNASCLDAQRGLRRAHPDLPLLDVRFEHIMDDLPTVVERVYAHAGMTLSDTARGNMLGWDEQNAMHKLGTFTYSVDDIGLDENVIRDRMGSYFELLDVLASHAARSATSE